MRSLPVAAVCAVALWTTACGSKLVGPDAAASDGGAGGGGTDAAAPTFASRCVGCTRTPIGVPTWNPGSVALFSGQDGLSLLQSLLAPRHQFYNDVQEFGPAVAHQPPYTDEIYDPLAARGITPTQTFSDADFTGLRSVIAVITIVPSPNAPISSSFDFPSGPVIPNEKFPITATGAVYRNGGMLAPNVYPNDATYSGYQEFSPPVYVSGVNPPIPAQGASHLFLTFQASTGNAPVPLPPPDGKYEYRWTLTDATGAGWSLTVPFVVGRGDVPSTGITLVPDANGSFDGTNAAGVVGAWWSTGDFYDGDTSPGSGTCAMAGFPSESCSMLTTPTPGAPFRPDPGGRGMCTAGIAAQVVNGTDGQPAYSSIWGNIIGFALASTGPRDAGSDALGIYDAPAHGITGFAFDIDAVPLGGQMRVTFPTKGTEKNAAYWYGATSNLSPIFAPGHYEMRWSEIGGPVYLTAAPPFDPTQLEMISFHVVSNTGAPTPYSFCINNVMLLTN